MTDFRAKTHDQWKHAKINTRIYGFQFQAGTQWNPGLSDSDINEYENELNCQFSNELRTVLRHINGTDKPTLNIYGNCGEPYCTGVGVYSYPRDIGRIKERIEDLKNDWKEIKEYLEEDDFIITEDMSLVPFYIHRYVVCGPNRTSGPVLSIHGSDAIIYAESLRQYLEKEFVNNG